MVREGVRVGVTLLGPERDAVPGKEGADRWSVFRPSVAFGLQQDVPFDRVVVVHQPRDKDLCDRVVEDIRAELGAHHSRRIVEPLKYPIRDFYEFDHCFAALKRLLEDLAAPRDSEPVDVYANVNTGSHGTMLAMYLLAFGRVLRSPLNLVQVSPAPRRGEESDAKNRNGRGASARVVDLSFRSYERVREEFQRRHEEVIEELSVIEVRDPAFRPQLEELMFVGAHTDDPIVLLGPSGAGKSRLAGKIHQAWAQKRRERGLKTSAFHQYNCAGLPEHLAESELFGHTRGAFTGATSDRKGLLEAANNGTLFLDEVADLSPSAQGKLLVALETKAFNRVGTSGVEHQCRSDFRLIAATNRDLAKEVAEGRFRADLYARIRCWEYVLPGLKQLRKDFPDYLDTQLEEWCRSETEAGRLSNVRFAPDARKRYLAFAQSDEAPWTGNYRDLQQSVRRMATLARREGFVGTIEVADVERELAELKRRWERPTSGSDPDAALEALVRLARGVEGNLCLLDRVHWLLSDWALRRAKSQAEAGRLLYARPEGPAPKNFTSLFAGRRKKLREDARAEPNGAGNAEEAPGTVPRLPAELD